jgi:hypothetical protein
MTTKLAIWIISSLGSLILLATGWVLKDVYDNAKQVPVIIIKVDDVKNQNGRYEELFEDAIRRDQEMKDRILILETKLKN